MVVAEAEADWAEEVSIAVAGGWMLFGFGWGFLVAAKEAVSDRQSQGGQIHAKTWNCKG